MRLASAVDDGLLSPYTYANASEGYTQRKQIVGQMQQMLDQDLPALCLYYENSYFIYRNGGFSAWYYPPAGDPGNPGAVTKQGLVTGRPTGSVIAPAPS